MKVLNEIAEKIQTCYHCGEKCDNSNIHINEKYFCCNGCILVYELLEQNDMCMYYNLDDKPGTSQKEKSGAFKYSYLEDKAIVNHIIDFTDGVQSSVTFFIPEIHCSSCIWLLENLYQINASIISSKVNFLRKEISLTYLEQEISLRQIVELLCSIGYEPQIQLDSIDKKVKDESYKDLYIKLGVAGFAFANIMLFSLPDYLAIQDPLQLEFVQFFGYLSLLLALPVLFYSSIDYFKSALNSFKQKMVNMEVPISLGIIALFSRSAYEILILNTSGYMDSFTGLIFLLLLGKLFQKKTYDSLSFDCDYKSFFPISVIRKKMETEEVIPIYNLNVGDRFVIKNNELIPTDSVLIKGDALIDYSFVTGESQPVEKKCGAKIYAGGKQAGGAIELDAVKEVSQSYLTQLWNHDTFTKKIESRMTSLSNRVSQYFTFIVLSIAFFSALYWIPKSWALAINAFTAVLIIACPCALALSTPFTLGNTLRIFGRAKFYLKNISVIEALSKIDTIVFDKTGTITHSQSADVEYYDLDSTNENDKVLIKSLVRHSTHPLSNTINNYLSDVSFETILEYKEEKGLGIVGNIFGTIIKIGSNKFINTNSLSGKIKQNTTVFVEIDNQLKGYFVFKNKYRYGLKNIISNLKSKFDIFLLTGDNEGERVNLHEIFGTGNNLYFNQSPYAKLDFIKNIQKNGKNALMVGDGLNDAGALKQSLVGISISEDSNVFSPACDGILESSNFNLLPKLIQFSKSSMRIIVVSFVISFLYNIVGLAFAIQGTLSPLIAAILMPLSSISVVVFTTGATAFLAKKRRLY
jgi:Cu+-exporting ATPase